MKKQAKKPIRAHKKAQWRPKRTNRTPFVFAFLFGLVMVAYGISQIFAATAVIFGMSPALQSSTAGQTKSITLTINPNGNYINGGNVRVTYNTNQLTFSKFTAANGTPYNLYSESHNNGVYSFSFFTYYGTNQTASLGTLEFQVKPASSTTTSNVVYTSGNTRAYRGTIFNPSYLTAQLNNAGITITVPVAPPPPPPAPSPSPSPSPTPSPSPSPSPSPTPSPSPSPSPRPSPPPNPTTGGSTNNSGDSGQPGGGSLGPDDSNPDGPANQTPNQQSPETPTTDEDESTNETDTDTNTNDESEFVASQGDSKPPLVPILAIVGGTLLLGGASLMYLKLRDKPTSGKKHAASLHGSLFDDAKPTEHQAPAPTHTDPKHHDKPTSSDVADPAAVTAAIIAQIQKDAAHKNHPVSTPASKPKLPEPHAKPTSVAAAAPTHPQPPAAPTAQQPVANAPHGIPAWQAQIIANQAAHSKVKKDDEPEDMFELAAEHPESFGSSQLYESESDHDKKDKSA